ncbi:MAG: bifunctional 2-polyprenyl-6-hydroxyphenol methylase/3-demethylubiquinol 3-O-methyltransferase UbiG [Deltaproteobacteria bacterium]|nr:bifunctional 2-polyprenyl-6-hydroxyphenol methylase/3-demethylubiquinol 3-O-methyltransferase UbiG [Deltaproteobacteria bacterium]
MRSKVGGDRAADKEPFEPFKGDWWDPAGEFSLLHKINPLRFEYFSGRATEVLGGLGGKRVLDVGCGGGLLSEMFAASGAVVTGIDPLPDAVRAAKKHAEEKGLRIDYLVSPAAGSAKESLKGKEFDCLVCSEVLEHVRDLPGFIADICQMLRKDGVFLFSTINRTVKARLLAIFVAEDVLGMIPKGTHDYGKFIRPSELARLLRENSVSVEEIRGMSLDALNLEFRLGRDTSVNYLGYGVKR